MVLHIKYQGTRLSGFDKKIVYDSPIEAYAKRDIWGGTIFGPRSIILTNFVELH